MGRKTQGVSTEASENVKGESIKGLEMGRLSRDGYNDAGSRVRDFEIRCQFKEGVFDEGVEGRFIR